MVVGVGADMMSTSIVSEQVRIYLHRDSEDRIFGGSKSDVAAWISNVLLPLPRSEDRQHRRVYRNMLGRLVRLVEQE